VNGPDRIAFIGFGEAARAFVASLRPLGPLRVAAYDIKVHGPEAGALRAAAGALGVALTESAAAAIAGAGIVVSAVTAAAAAEALGPAYDRPVHPHTLIDLNSVSAGVKRANAARVRAAGARYLDMAVMAPVHPAGHRTPVLVAGDLDPVLDWLRSRDFRVEALGPEVGAAASVKMVRSLFVKGLEAITVQTLAAAEAAGCGERVLASLAGSYPGLDLPRTAPYQAERVATHGRRRAEELREVAVSMAELGMAEGADLARAIAAVQDAAAGAPVGPDAATSARALAQTLSTPSALDRGASKPTPRRTRGSMGGERP
jgi:3-hydroxyisobutyrate dehydrogenase-like beta-hydroxyacid dehydrogenase